MASHLASIYGTERDKVNCSFYHKIGACRHGDRCSRKHIKPNYSQTVLLANLYQNPAFSPTNTLNDAQLQEHFDLFFEDMFLELSKYGELEELNVCDNVGDHLVGNVYAMFKFEDSARKCVDAMNNRYYAGKPIYAELSPVTDFGEACCRQYEQTECTRGGLCNFMHLRKVSRSLLKGLIDSQRKSLHLKAGGGPVREEDEYATGPMGQRGRGGPEEEDPRGRPSRYEEDRRRREVDYAPRKRSRSRSRERDYADRGMDRRRYR